MKSPINLNSSIQTINGNQVVEFEQTSLQNPFRTAMWVDEIRFMNFAPNFILTNPWATYRIDIKLGREPITNGFVPVGLLSPLVQETTTPVDSPLSARLHWTWPLEKPLYVPPTEQLIIRAKADNPYPAFNLDTVITAMVGLAGRSLPRDHPTPEVVNMPWATSFMTTAVPWGSTGSFRTSEADLNNPFAQPMRVNRFFGRGFNNYGLDSPEMLGGISGRSTVRAADSFGTIIVRDPTPFTQLFFYGLRSWAPRATLGPKGFYLFNIDQDYSDLTDAGDPSQGFGIGFTGHREVRLM